MKPPSEQFAAPNIRRALGEILGVPDDVVAIRHPTDERTYDFHADASGIRLGIEYSATPYGAVITSAINHLKGVTSRSARGRVPVIVVPFMGPVGERLCEESRISWFDLSGNARIVAPGLRVLVEGKPNRFVARGRPSSAFAPKSSRITRWLLYEPDRAFSQSELAQYSDLDDGYVSKVVRRLEREGYLERDPSGKVRPKDPALLLETWREAYSFERHHIVKGNLPARSGEDLVRKLTQELPETGLQWALTGLCAAWEWTAFASFRLGTVYVADMPSSATLRKWGFQEDDRGANLWFVIPNDGGVFQGTSLRHGTCCVHPVQTYLDLKSHPERSEEAAASLRRILFDGSSHGSQTRSIS